MRTILTPPSGRSLDLEKDNFVKAEVVAKCDHLSRQLDLAIAANLKNLGFPQEDECRPKVTGA